jgi:hypothetical protein
MNEKEWSKLKEIKDHIVCSTNIPRSEKRGVVVRRALTAATLGFFFPKVCFN